MDPKHSKFSCPRCGSPRVYRSHRKSLIEHLLSQVGAKVRRCHQCSHRFMTFGASTFTLRNTDKLSHQLAALLFTSTGLGACVGFVWWIINHLSSQ